jgi:NADH:ubiquinone oxidoreductase subunit F (NADH-binding)
MKCTKCKCKYRNDDVHIVADFALNSFNERYKTCKKCRACRKPRGKTHKLLDTLPDESKANVTEFKNGYSILENVFQRVHKSDRIARLRVA